MQRAVEDSKWILNKVIIDKINCYVVDSKERIVLNFSVLSQKVNGKFILQIWLKGSGIPLRSGVKSHM